MNLATPDLYRCPRCIALNAASLNEWCLCTTRDRTLVCRECGHCFCSAEETWKQTFWTVASPALVERRRRDREQHSVTASVEPDSVPRRPLILLIDDDRTVHAIVRRVLQSFGGSLIHAYDGEEGLRLARVADPELVITDALLPKLDGREIAAELKRVPRPGRHVVVMTAIYRGLRYRNEAFRTFHVDEFLEKPVSATKLRELVERMLHVQLEAKAAS